MQTLFSSVNEERRWEAGNRISSLARVFKIREKDILIAGGFARDLALKLEPTDIDMYMYTPKVKEETFLTAFLYAAFDDVDEVVEKTAEKPGYVNGSIYKVYGVTFTDDSVLPLDIIFLNSNPLGVPGMELSGDVKSTVLPFACNMSNAYFDDYNNVFVLDSFLHGAINKTFEYYPTMVDAYKEKMKLKFPEWEHKDITL